MRPSVGRIVHFMNGPLCFAAVITQVSEYPANVSEVDKDNIAVPVGLHIFFPPQSPDAWRDADLPAVMQSELGREHGTWHWPERVG